MFTLKMLLILTILSLCAYLGKTLFQFLFYSTGLRGVSALRKWSDKLGESTPGHIDASVNFGPGQDSAAS